MTTAVQTARHHCEGVWSRVNDPAGVAAARRVVAAVLCADALSCILIIATVPCKSLRAASRHDGKAQAPSSMLQNQPTLCLAVVRRYRNGLGSIHAAGPNFCPGICQIGSGSSGRPSHTDPCRRSPAPVSQGDRLTKHYYT